jgi:hypothetical protein
MKKRAAVLLVGVVVAVQFLALGGGEGAYAWAPTVPASTSIAPERHPSARQKKKEKNRPVCFSSTQDDSSDLPKKRSLRDAIQKFDASAATRVAKEQQESRPSSSLGGEYTTWADYRAVKENATNESNKSSMRAVLADRLRELEEERKELEKDPELSPQGLYQIKSEQQHA